MSKSLLRDDGRATGFTETLGTVDEARVKANHKSGSARIQSGLSVMYEKSRLEGLAAGQAEGFGKGYDEGREQGRQSFEEAHASALDEFTEALHGFVDRAQSAVDAWYVRAEDELTTLAIEIARRALCKELESSRESILEITRQALAEVRHGTEVRVKVNPFDASILESRKQQVLSAVSGIRQLEVVADTNIVSGCEIETDGGVIDARIESYLARIAKEAA